MRSCGLMQKLIKFNLAHEATMMRFCEFLSNENFFSCQILAKKTIPRDCHYSDEINTLFNAFRLKRKRLIFSDANVTRQNLIQTQICGVECRIMAGRAIIMLRTFLMLLHTTFFLLALGQRHIFFRLTNNGNVPCLAKPMLSLISV